MNQTACRPSAMTDGMPHVHAGHFASVAPSVVSGCTEGMLFAPQQVRISPVVIPSQGPFSDGIPVNNRDGGCAPMCSPSPSHEALHRQGHSKRSFSPDVDNLKSECSTPVVTVLIGENTNRSQATTSSDHNAASFQDAAVDGTAKRVRISDPICAVSNQPAYACDASKMDIQSYPTVPHMNDVRMAPSAVLVSTTQDGPVFGGPEVTTQEALQSRYRLTKILRNSLFGQVFTAVDRVTNQFVAVKVSNVAQILSGRSLSGAKVLENPLKETEIMRQLRFHMPPTAFELLAGASALEASVVSSQVALAGSLVSRRGESSPVFEGSYPAGYKHVLRLLSEHYDSGNALHWMVLEYCPNGEFFDFVVKNKFLNEATTRHYFRQMLLGLSFMHSANICHLDFSLENLLMDDVGQIKICDFGVSRVMPEDGSCFAPLAHEKPGKLRYMAPEILRGEAFDGRKADMFSLGVVLFMCLAGFPPFESAARQDPRFAMASSGRLLTMLQVLRVSERFPAGAVDLLNGLFCVDPSKRLSLQQVMNHPWVTA